MRARPGLIGVCVSLASGATFAGCGAHKLPLSAVCTGDPGPIERAIARAPDAVRLADGTSISTCVSRALDDGQLQSLGATFTAVADDLAARARSGDRPAVALGYLIGAARRGAAHSNGINAELVRRLEQEAVPYGAPGPRHAAVDRGIQAGSRLG
jgi:hypothetical protein